MTFIRYGDDDRRRLREEAAEQAEIGAEYLRICRKYAGVARRPTDEAEERHWRLLLTRERLQIRPYGDQS